MVCAAAAQQTQVEILTEEKGVIYDAGTQLLTDRITKCRLKFPMEPTSKLTRVTTPHGIIMVRSHTANLGDMVLTMTQTKHPKQLLETMGVDLAKNTDVEKFIDMSSEHGARSRKDAKVRSRMERTLENGVKGLEQAISYPGAEDGSYETGLTIERTFMHNGLLYVVFAEVTREVLERDRNTPKRVLELLDSFTLLTTTKEEEAKK